MPIAPDGDSSTSARQRFRELDAYRVEREWARYEGTPQRDLFRTLRVRFLKRHAASAGRTLEIGPGPGRFSPWVGTPESHRIVLDLSLGMLESLEDRWPRSGGPVPSRVRGDAVRLPVRERSFSVVVALGNPLGFSADRSEELLDRAAASVAPGGTLLLETVAGPGERSNYLGRLPGGAIRRLLRSPSRLVLGRIEVEGFAREPVCKAVASRFRRWSDTAIGERLARSGFHVAEATAVAPALGADPERVAAVHEDALAWTRLIEAEEALGRSPERRAAAAAVLVAAVRSE